MAKPNRALARIAKRPYEPDKQFPWARPDLAHTRAAELEAEGWQVKITRFKMGPKRDPILYHNVWKRRPA